MRRVKGVYYVGIVAVDARYGWVVLEDTYYSNTPGAVGRFGELRGLREQFMRVFEAPTLDKAERLLDAVLKPSSRGRGSGPSSGCWRRTVSASSPT